MSRGVYPPLLGIYNGRKHAKQDATRAANRAVRLRNGGGAIRAIRYSANRRASPVLLIQLMDSELIKLLLAGPVRKSSTSRKGYALIKQNGKLERVPLKGLNLGHFEGRQGSIRRSRKGRTSIRPNGYVRYVPYGNPDNVVAYKA